MTTIAAAVSVAFAGAGPVSAQEEAIFGIPPAASTADALNPPPGVDRERDLGVHASIGVSYLHTDNVRRTPDGESDDGFTISPALTYKAALGRHTAQLGASAELARFNEFDDEDYDSYTLDGAINLDVTRKLDIDAFAAFTAATESRGSSGSRVVQTGDRDEVEILAYGARATYGRLTNRIQLRAGVDREEWRYQNNAQDFRDRDVDNLRGAVYYNFSPRTSLFARVVFSDIEYVRPIRNLDSEETSYSVGVRWQATAQTRGEFSVGRQEKEFDDPGLKDFEGTVYNGRIRWMPTRRTGVNLYGSRTTEETTTVEDGFFVSELLGISADHALTERLTAIAYFNHTDDEFDSGREDEIQDYGIGFDYALLRWLSVGARYGHIERESNDPLAEFEEEFVKLTLRGDFFLTGGGGRRR